MTFKEHFLVEVNLNECTSVATTIQGKTLIAKNRDRTYIPKVKIVREIINGLETAYMYDEDTDYAEGMNEAGIGIVNTTLQGKSDEKEGRPKKFKRTKMSKDGFKIRKALGYSKIKQVVKSLDLYDRGLGGHTTVGCKNYFVTIEKLKFGKPFIKKHSVNNVIVRTNHGIRYPDQGYQKGKDRESSMSRFRLANSQARKSEMPEDLLKFLRVHHKDIPGYLEPYRTNYKVWTSSQIMMNLTDLVMTFVVDENTNFLGIENRLPKNYKPKIEIKLEKVSMSLNSSPLN
jgi:hypothetical protein